MSICYKNFPRRLVSALLVMGVAMSIAQAGDRAEKYSGENRGKPAQPSQVNAKFQQNVLPATSHMRRDYCLLHPGARSWAV